MNRPVAANLMWNMTRKCNFACRYCYYPHDHSPVDQTLDPEALAALLDRTGYSWTVTLTGGEPFLYPDFVGICRCLTENQFIEIDSNLSLSDLIARFAEAVEPGRVKLIYASLHIEERERRNGVDAFIKNAHLLMNKGFKVKVNYVIHPRVAGRFQRDWERFKKLGIELVPRPFKGVHQGKPYPESYDQRTRTIFQGQPKAGAKMVFDFKGIPCEGGRTFVRLEPDGTFFRCSGDKTVLGQLGRGVRLNDRAEPCAAASCPCRGLDHVHLNPAQQAFINGLILANIGDFPRSRQAFEEACNADPDHAGAINNLGVLSMGEQDRDGAEELLAKAQALSPDNEVIAANYRLAKATGSNPLKPTDYQLCRQVVWRKRPS